MITIVRQGLIVLCFLCFAARGSAASLQIQIYQGGQPVIGANVCVGTYQERALYWLTKTNERGFVLLSDLPEGRIVITADKSGSGKDEIITNSVYSKSVMLALPNIEGGPLCPQVKQ